MAPKLPLTSTFRKFGANVPDVDVWREWRGGSGATMSCFQDLTLELARMVVDLLEYDDIVPCMQTCRLLLAACSEITLVFVRLTPTGPSRRTGSTLKLKLHPLSTVLETLTSARLVTPRLRMPAGGYECDVYPRSRLRVSNTVNTGPSLHDIRAQQRHEREALKQELLAAATTSGLSVALGVAAVQEAVLRKLRNTYFAAGRDWSGHCHRQAAQAAFPGRSAILDDFCYPACDDSSPWAMTDPMPYDTRCLTERVAVDAAVFADGHWHTCDVKTLKWVELHLLGCEESTGGEEERARWFDDPTRAACDCKKYEEDDSCCVEMSQAAVDIGDRLSAADLKCTLRAGPCTVVLGLRADNTQQHQAAYEDEDGDGVNGFDPTVIGLHPTAKDRVHSAKGELSLMDALVFVPSAPARPASHELGPRAARAPAHVQHMVPLLDDAEDFSRCELSDARYVAL